MDGEKLVLKQISDRLRGGWVEHYGIMALLASVSMSVEDAVAEIERTLGPAFVLERKEEERGRRSYRIRQPRRATGHNALRLI